MQTESDLHSLSEPLDPKMLNHKESSNPKLVNGYHNHSDHAVDLKDKNNNNTTPNSVSNGPPQQIDDDELKRLVSNQLEFYFSRENLLHDKYLISQMDNDNYVPIIILANFNMIKKLFASSKSFVSDSIEHRVEFMTELVQSQSQPQSQSQLQLDQSGTKLRANHKRCVVILREIDKQTPVESILELFDNCNVKCLNCEFAGNRSWYLTFKDEQEAQIAVQFLKEEVQSFNGEALFARIKTNPIPRVSASANGNAKVKTDEPNNSIINESASSVDFHNKSIDDSGFKQSASDSKSLKSSSSTNDDSTTEANEASKNQTEAFSVNGNSQSQQQSQCLPQQYQYPTFSYNQDAFKYFNYINSNQNNHNYYINNGTSYPNPNLPNAYYNDSNTNPGQAPLALLANPWMYYTPYLTNNNINSMPSPVQNPTNFANKSNNGKTQTTIATNSTSTTNTDNSSSSNSNSNNNLSSSSSSISNLPASTSTTSTASATTTATSSTNPIQTQFQPALISPLDQFIFQYGAYPHPHQFTSHYIKQSYNNRTYNSYGNKPYNKQRNYYNSAANQDKSSKTPVDETLPSQATTPSPTPSLEATELDQGTNNAERVEPNTETQVDTEAKTDDPAASNQQQQGSVGSNYQKPYRSYNSYNNKYSKTNGFNQYNLGMYQNHNHHQLLFPGQLPGSFGFSQAPYGLNHLGQFAHQAQMMPPQQTKSYSSYHSNASTNQNNLYDSYQDYLMQPNSAPKAYNSNRQYSSYNGSKTTAQTTEQSSLKPKVNGYVKKSLNSNQGVQASKSSTDAADLSDPAANSDNSARNGFGYEKRSSTTSQKDFPRERSFNKFDKTQMKPKPVYASSSGKEAGAKPSEPNQSLTSFQKKSRYNKTPQSAELPSHPSPQQLAVQFDYEPNSFPPLNDSEQSQTPKENPKPKPSEWAKNEQANLVEDAVKVALVAEELKPEAENKEAQIVVDCREHEEDCSNSRRSFADIVKQKQRQLALALANKANMDAVADLVAKVEIGAGEDKNE